jgi:hypothetical protein
VPGGPRARGACDDAALHATLRAVAAGGCEARDAIVAVDACMRPDPGVYSRPEGDGSRRGRTLRIARATRRSRANGPRCADCLVRAQRRHLHPLIRRSLVAARHELRDQNKRMTESDLNDRRTTEQLRLALIELARIDREIAAFEPHAREPLDFELLRSLRACRVALLRMAGVRLASADGDPMPEA